MKYNMRVERNAIAFLTRALVLRKDNERKVPKNEKSSIRG